MIGKRIGYGRESMAPHSLTMTMIGASLLWVGWFGFNAGSNLEANGVAALAFVNTMIATAAATVSWTLGEWMGKGKPSMLGAASGAVAGLVAITPACGFVGPMGALVIGLIAGVVCLWGVNGLKRMLGADDSLDVFGVHGVGGIVGALLTGVFAAPSLGGTGVYDYVANAASADYSISGQVWVQAQGGAADGRSGRRVVAFIAFKLVDMVDRTARARGGRARGAGHQLARRDRVPLLNQSGRRRPISAPAIRSPSPRRSAAGHTPAVFLRAAARRPHVATIGAPRDSAHLSLR